MKSVIFAALFIAVVYGMCSNTMCDGCTTNSTCVNMTSCSWKTSTSKCGANSTANATTNMTDDTSSEEPSESEGEFSLIRSVPMVALLVMILSLLSF